MKSLTAYVLGAAAMGERPSPIKESPADRAEKKAFCAPLI